MHDSLRYQDDANVTAGCTLTAELPKRWHAGRRPENRSIQHLEPCEFKVLS